MAYCEFETNEAVWLQGQSLTRAVRLGDPERQVILSARRDAQAGRCGAILPDARLDALRRYVMLAQRRTAEAGLALMAAGFTATERRIVDAMIGALPVRSSAVRPATGRLVVAALILVPLLIAIGAYSWANVYLEDRLIAVVLGGLALLLVMPLAGAMAAPPARRGAGY